MKKFFTLFLTLFVASSVWAYDFEVDGIYYTFDSMSETVAVTRGLGYSGDVTIPSSVAYNGNSYSVTSIGFYAFGNCNLTSVTIPNSVTSIETWAFKDCSGLTSITIPNSVTSIGEEAFEFCSGLTSITIPNSVTSIGERAFSSCSSLTSVTIPNSVTSIGSEAFYECSGLTSITMPDVLDVSKAQLFVIKDGIQYLILNNKEVKVAHKEEKYIGDVVIPASISALGNTFAVTSIGNSAFLNCSNLTSVTIPNSVTSIGNSAFEGCKGLTSITIPNSVTSIGEEAFSGCIWTSITIPNSVTSIGSKAFSWCIGLTSITIPNSVTSVGSEAFYECSGLTSVTIIPNSVTNIWPNAFKYCNNLTSVTINGDLTVSDADLCFKKEGWRYRVLNKNTVEVAGGNNSGDIMIPASVTAGNTFAVVGIGNSAFPYSTELTSIVIPNSVTSVGSNAFSGCTKLKDVTCLATTPPDAYANSFENYNGYLHVPCESKEEYDFANCWGSFKHVECIGSETVELTKDEVAVVPDKTEAVFSMPKNENANSYTLTISNNGVTFCTLTFNAQGQLANIDFSSTKSYELKSGIEAFQFTVTGLSTSEAYGYSFKALNSSKAVLNEYAGSFTTKNADGTGGSVQGGGEGSGQGGSTAVSEVSNATAVTIVNGQILVNGEAPAFVVTVAGQKIANANLKAGVYFVVVDGETVGVSVR